MSVAAVARAEVVLTTYDVIKMRSSRKPSKAAEKAAQAQRHARPCNAPDSDEDSDYDNDCVIVVGLYSTQADLSLPLA
jgi:hypothetical protein